MQPVWTPLLVPHWPPKLSPALAGHPPSLLSCLHGPGSFLNYFFVYPLVPPGAGLDDSGEANGAVGSAVHILLAVKTTLCKATWPAARVRKSPAPKPHPLGWTSLDRAIKYDRGQARRSFPSRVISGFIQRLRAVEGAGWRVGIADMVSPQTCIAETPTEPPSPWPALLAPVTE